MGWLLGTLLGKHDGADDGVILGLVDGVDDGMLLGILHWSVMMTGNARWIHDGTVDGQDGNRWC